MTKRQGKAPGITPQPVSDNQASPGDALSILRRLAEGEIGPDEAEAEASAAGLPPIASEPPASRFDARSKPEWSLAMVLAWIVTRDFDAVRQRDNEFLDRKYELRGTCRLCEQGDLKHKKCAARWTLEKARPVNMFTAELSLLNDETIAPKHEDRESLILARKGELWEALCSGKLRARAVDVQGPPRVVEIPLLEWPRLQPAIETDPPRDYLCFEYARGIEVYRDITITRVELLKEFPPNPTGAIGKRATEADCRNSLQAQIKASPDNPKIKRGDFVKEWAAKGMTKRQVISIWTTCTAGTAWAKAGRRKEPK